MRENGIHIIRRGADIDRDHHLVVAYVKLKIKRTGTPFFVKI